MKTKKERVKGVSPLLDKIMRRNGTSPMRDATYYRGYNAAQRSELKALLNQPFIKNGIVVISMKSSDVSMLDKSNAVGSAVWEFIHHGNFIESFEVDANGVGVRKEIKDEDIKLLTARNLGKIDPMDLGRVLFPRVEEIRENIKYVAIPGQVVLEAKHGFTPYILIGTRAPEAVDTKWTRISMPIEEVAAQNWMKYVLTQVQNTVF